MNEVLASLHRLRTHSRRETQLAVQRAELERDQQKEKVEDLHSNFVSARAGVDPCDVHELAHWQAWRLRGEMQVRREGARLAQRERELEAQTTRHLRAVRDELCIESLRESAAERASAHARAADRKRMDELASHMRRAG